MMALIKRHDRTEGQNYDRDSVVSYGKSTLSTGKYDGWYLMFTWPFSQNKKYISTTTFEPVDGSCRYTILYTRRVPNEKRGYISGLRKGWFPIDV